jgi:hypothetical protein
MARTKNPAPARAPHAARSAADAATGLGPRPLPRLRTTAPQRPVLAAMSAEPGGATVAVIARHTGISTAAARQALIAHEKAGTAVRVKGGRPGVPDTWKPAGPADPAPPAEAPGTGSTPGAGQPPAVDSAADVGQPAPAPVAGSAECGKSEAATATDPDSAVTAEAAGNVLAVAEAADEARKALAAGDLAAFRGRWSGTAKERSAAGGRASPS